MNSPHVMVLFNEPVLPKDHPDAASEHEILDTVDRVETILKNGHLITSRLGIGMDPMPLMRSLRQFQPDVVFNLFEGLATRTETEAVVAGLLDWFDIPFTGSPASALTIGRDKYRTKNLLQGAGIPTPKFRIVDRLPVDDWSGVWPRMVKPAFQDASVGIEQGSVVENVRQMERRIAWVIERYGAPVLVEEFIFGREFLVSVIEERNEPGRLTVLPFSEIVFQPTANLLWPIYSYDAKWATDSLEYQATPLDVPVILNPELTHRIESIARASFQLLGCRDYARVDLRVTADDEPYVLEVNPNPFINSIAVQDGLEAMGRSHEQFVQNLAWMAYERRSKPLVTHVSRASSVEA